MIRLYRFVKQFLFFKVRTYTIQWNPSNPDTLGTPPSVLIRGVSSFQGLHITSIYLLAVGAYKYLIDGILLNECCRVI